MNLLFLRGLVRDQRCWGDFPSRIQNRAPHLKPFFLDLPGVGTEAHRPSPPSIPAIRIDLAKRFHEKVAQGKFPQGPWSIVSISLGGMIAIDWVAAEPDLFAKMVVINSSSSDVAALHERASFKMLPKMLLAFLSSPERSEKLILEIVSNRFETPDAKMLELLQNQIRWRKEAPIKRTTFFRQLGSGASYRLPRNRPKPKTLIVNSEGDRLVSPLCSVRIAERFGAKLITHPWAGHDIPIDDPEWLARETTDWLEAP